MKRKFTYIIAAIIIVINIVICAFILNKLGNDPALKETQEFHSTMKNSSEGTNEDPQARAKYEFMRLHDPVTGLVPHGIRSKELAFASKLPKKFDKAYSNSRAKNIQSQTWIQRGPYDVGGRTRSLAIDVANEARILAGGVSGGMWISADTGYTWNHSTAYSQLRSVSCVGQDRRVGHQNVWYYGTGEVDGNSAGIGVDTYLGDGIFKSLDSGLTWSVLPSTAKDTPQVLNNNFDYVWTVASYPFDTVHDVVFAATYGHIYRSMDGGTSWNSVLGINNNASAYSEISVSPTGILYASLSPSLTHGLYRSADSGTTWTNITPTGWPSTFHRTMIAIAPSNENTVYFLSETPSTGKLGHNLWRYTYLSGDGSGAGGSWTNISQSIPNLGGNGAFSSQGSYDMFLKVKPDNDSVVFLGGTNVYRSTNGFADTTTTVAIGGYNLGATNPILLGVDGVYPNHHPDQHNLQFFSDPSKMLTSNDGGIQMTYDDMSSNVAWRSLNNGYYNSQFYTIAIDHATPNDPIIVGGMQDNGNFFTNSTVATVPWLPITGADGTYAAIADHKDFYYGSIQSGVTGRLNISTAGVVNPLTLAEIDPVGGGPYLFVNPFLLDPNNSNRMYLAGGSYLWRNDNLASIPNFNFAPTSVGWTKLTSSFTSGSISAIGAGKLNDVVYYGSSNGRIYRIDNPDIGAAPTKVDVWTGKGLPPNAYVSCIAVDPIDGNTAIATFSNYSIKSIFLTHDAGNTWTSISGNLEEHADGNGNGPSVRWASIIPTQDSVYYFVGTSTGLYSTTKLNGDSTVWTQEGTNTIGNVVVDYIDFRQLDGLVVIASHGNGVFSTNLANPSGIPNVKTAQNLTLGDVFPNPFSNNITIHFSISNTAQVSLKIMDITGREVCILENKIMQAGTYDYTWNGRSKSGVAMANGIYHASLTSGNTVLNRKVVLMR